MATPNINVVLQGILAVTNNLLTPAPQIVNFDLNNPTLPSAGVGGTIASFIPYFLALAGGSGVSLPVTKVFAFAVQNLSPTGLLNVSYTPTGGTANTITVGPNGVVIIFDPSEAGAGITQIILNGVTATIPCSVLVAA